MQEWSGRARGLFVKGRLCGYICSNRRQHVLYCSPFEGPFDGRLAEIRKETELLVKIVQDFGGGGGIFSCIVFILLFGVF